MIRAKEGGERMKGFVRKILMFVFAVAFLVSTAFLIRQLLDKRAGEDTYSDALMLASGTDQETDALPAREEPVQQELPPEPEVRIWVPEVPQNDPVAEEMAAMDLDALRAKNPDVVGWIRIPDTKINYPLMQGADNDYYLTHTWEGQNNTVGSIFLECQNSRDFADYNTIVYGHNMNNGSMFAQLHRYAEKGFPETHPYVYILTDAGVLRYEVFSAYRAEVDSIAYGLQFTQEGTKAGLVYHALEQSRIDTGIRPEANDRILTLSTCSGAGYSNRWVVHARLKMVEITG